jgi:polynucleotide 5'-triphosphatase
MSDDITSKIGLPKGVDLSPFKDGTEALFGTKTMDESLRLLGDMIFRNLTGKNIEIEGKIGKIVDRHTQVPFSDTMSQLQLRSETVLVHRHPNSEFISTLSKETFQQLNSILNKRYEVLKEAQQKQGYKGPVIQYERVVEADRFYKDKNSPEWIRVSIDPETEEKKRAIRKTRLQNIDFFCPHRRWDFRVTISEEQELPIPGDEELPVRERRKDRLSYTFDMWRIDITVVRKSNMNNYGVPFGDYIETYEVEMECNTDVMLEHRQLWLDKQPNQFLHFTKSLLKNMRTLNKQCDPPAISVPQPVPQPQHAPVIQQKTRPRSQNTPSFNKSETDERANKRSKTQ